MPIGAETKFRFLSWLRLTRRPPRARVNYYLPGTGREKVTTTHAHGNRSEARLPAANRVKRFEVEEFVRGFTAVLVTKDVTTIRPKHVEDLRALHEMWRYLRNEVEAVRKRATDKALLQDLVLIRNALAPGPTGAHDQFESLLRDLQFSSTESPNPHYDDIELTTSKPFARSTLEQMDVFRARITEAAAKVYLEAIQK